jgi:two-component system sensor histidine kinase UhpB
LAEIAAQVDDGAPVRRVTISDISVRKQAELAQRRLHEENTRLGREMIRLQEVERTNLARELHDGLSQQLVAIRAYAGAIRRAAGESKAAANAAAIEAAVSEIYAASHRMLEGLHPQILDGAGLHAAVGLLLTGHAEAFPETRIWLRSAGNVELMDPGARISLFRVVQECLTNATAHSGARRIRVFLGERQQSSGPRLRLVVRDDGRGADLSVEHAGYGLIVMRERVRAMGGQLSFSSRPGQGLRVMADVPAGSRGP